jgi:hypothetical protein
MNDNSSHPIPLLGLESTVALWKKKHSQHGGKEKKTKKKEGKKK